MFQASPCVPKLLTGLQLATLTVSTLLGGSTGQATIELAKAFGNVKLLVQNPEMLI